MSFGDKLAKRYLDKRAARLNAIYKDQMPGGLGDGKTPEDFDSEVLKEGAEDEMSEHTKDLELAQEIAIDHLAKDPEYYSKLKKCEKDSK